MRQNVILLASLLCASGCAIPTVQYSRVEEQSIATEPLEAIELVTFNGAISVESHDAHTVDMEITYKAYGDSEEDARFNCEQLQCDVTADKGTLIIKATKPTDQWSASAAFKLKVPKHCLLKLRSSNGKISVQDMAASVAAESSNGTVLLERIDAAVVAHTSNGTIDVQQCTGTIDLKTSNGKVLYSGLLAGRDNQIRTSNGAVTLRLEPASITEVQANTSNGSVRCSLATQRVIEESKKSLHAIVGDGQLDGESCKVSVRTSNGSIKIESLETGDDAPVTESESSDNDTVLQL
jgi:DUF4097 and DUF4098 domain-containing protein YvlB